MNSIVRLLILPLVAAGVLAPFQGVCADDPLEPAEGTDEGAWQSQSSDNLGGRGLLDFQDPFPVAALHLQLPADPHENLAVGETVLGVHGTWSNSYGVSNLQETVVDAETGRFRLSAWHAVHDKFYVGAAWALHLRGRGVTDGVIDGFHDLFSLNDGDRDQRPENDYDVSVTDENGNNSEVDRGVGSGDVVLRTHWNAFRGTRLFPAVSLATQFSLPTSNTGFGSEGIDLGLNLTLTKQIGRWLYVYGSVGGTLLTDRTTEGLHYRKKNYQFVAGLEVPVNPDVSLIFQGMILSPLLDSPRVLSQQRRYLLLGSRWMFAPGIELELSMIENLDPFKTTADFGFNAGFNFDL